MNFLGLGASKFLGFLKIVEEWNRMEGKRKRLRVGCLHHKRGFYQ